MVASNAEIAEAVRYPVLNPQATRDCIRFGMRPIDVRLQQNRLPQISRTPAAIPPP
jgi:hypothetical protein